MIELHAHAAFSRRLDYAQALRHHFLADAVAGHDRDRGLLLVSLRIEKRPCDLGSCRFVAPMPSRVRFDGRKPPCERNAGIASLNRSPATPNNLADDIRNPSPLAKRAIPWTGSARQALLDHGAIDRCIGAAAAEPLPRNAVTVRLLPAAAPVER